jgi:DNA invertase Pin-like site-specific DNA recombinase
MNEKCAIYLRVSSDLQDYERQISDMKKFAKDNHFSFSNGNLYEDKLSGFKNEKEREGLKKLLKEVIESEIKIILVWEISRLARKHRDLLEITEFFQNNGINVYFFIQRFWLLDETLKVSPQAGLSIAFFGWHGEYEARLTKERFLSAKRLNESLGKYNGGKIPFGFSLDEGNRYIVNNNRIESLNVSESDIVKEVFDLYEQGLTCSKICRICRSKGYPKIVCNNHTLARLLRNTSYLGYKEVKLGKRHTPSLIDQTQFDNVNNLINANKTKADKGKKHIYLLRGVLKCTFCEDYYVGKQTDDSYICPKNSGSNKANKNSFCKGGNISVSNIDGIIWERVKNRLLSQKSDGFDNIIEGGEINLLELKDQIIRYKDLISKTDQKRKKTNIIFQNDGYSIDEYQKAIRDINNEKIECEKAIESMESNIRYYEKLKIESNKLSKRIENINSITDRLQMQTIIKSLIKNVIFHKVSYYKTIVSIHYYGGYNEILLYNSVSKKGNIYKLIDSKYIRFDLNDKIFYFLNESQHVIFRARTEIINKERIGMNLPEYISLQDFARLIRTYNLTNIKESDFLDPYPDRTNSLMFDFEGLMKHEDVPDILNTHYYTKLTYFKDLNKSRFSRKKNFKK